MYVLVELLDSFSKDLNNCEESDVTKNFLMEEIKVLEEAKWIGLPNFMPRAAFLTILQRKVNGIAKLPIDFVDNVWEYLGKVVTSILTHHSENYYQLQCSSRRAGQNLISKMKECSIKHVMVAVEMEQKTDYTCNTEFTVEYNSLISQQVPFVDAVLDAQKKPSQVMLEGVGMIDVSHLREYSDVLNQAFDLKVRMIAYWKIVKKRLIDTIALHLMLSISNFVNKDLEKEIVHDLLSPIGGGIERLLVESPSISGKRERLRRSVKVLRESKDTVGNIIDKIASYGE
ncbi:unnamed protein product [Lupinus luteus]|uniref:GED domain-containing protein n=1 Tax=Lupinus luteus TaxID=3873 RepID=A0AAV1WAT7_LUPLU